MSITAGQAADALREIERTERRTRVSGGYAAASPHLILWGLVWALGYVGCGLLPPERWGLVWLPLIVLGAIGSAWFASRAGRPRAAGASGGGARPAMMAAAIAVFMLAAYTLFKPSDPLAYLVFPALVTGLVYTLAGLVAGLSRFVWIGAGVFALSIGGYLATPALAAFWIAAAGGGGLLLGGLWLRKV